MRYPGQNISILAFFNHIWSILLGVNGNPLVVFMTCTNICQVLCGVSKMGIAFSYFELLYDSVEICAQILGSRYLGI